VDATASLAVGLLVVVLAGRLVLLASATPALQSAQLLASSRPTAEGAARLVLIVDRDEPGAAAHEARARASHPGWPVDVSRIAWPAGDGAHSRGAHVAALVRAYGYGELPVLLTLSREGQVVRVQPFGGEIHSP
jgi:hypothetical protein